MLLRKASIAWLSACASVNFCATSSRVAALLIWFSSAWRCGVFKLDKLFNVSVARCLSWANFWSPCKLFLASVTACVAWSMIDLANVGSVVLLIKSFACCTACV